VIGVVSESDLLNKLALGGENHMPGKITGILRPGAFDVAVTDGVVTLVGWPQTRQQGHEIVFRARHVQGVVAVRDRFDYPAPGPDAFDVLARFTVD
jgi:BON domain